jgi:cell division transport system permease protein
MRFQLLLAESLRSVRASLSTTFAATITVLIGMFLLGVALLVGTWANSWIGDRKKELVVNVFYCTDTSCPRDVTPLQINSVRERLERDPRVAQVRFVSKEEALEIMKERTPDLVEDISFNPLPDSQEVTPKNPDDVTAIAAGLDPLPAGVQKVNYGEETAESILWWGRLVWFFFVAMVILLLAASTLLIANTIRLSIFARRREIEVMKLVGASNWFVRGPFMLEGVFVGLVGSLIAVVLLLMVKDVAIPSIFESTSRSDSQPLSSVWTALILLAVGLGLGAASSGLTLRRFLRV